jgi:hypothetical protein
MTEPSPAAWYIVFDVAGDYAGCGFTPDGTIPEGGKVCTQEQHDASGQWTKFIDDAIVIGARPGPTIVERAVAAIAAGVTITSISTPALNGIYPCNEGAQAKVAAVALYIKTNGRFPGGVTQFPWLDVDGAIHLFPTTDQFQQAATAIADYVALIDFAAIGHAADLPAPPAPIS